MGKKFLITCVMLIAMGMNSMAQKLALVDMEYILKNIPAYERANEQLNQTSKKWQTEVETLNNAAKQKKAKEQAILQKEKEASELKKKYFSPEGELYKKRESLIGPIQDEIYNAVKTVAEQRGYQLVLDRASDNGIVFASPAADISNEVLGKLGYSK